MFTSQDLHLVGCNCSINADTNQHCKSVDKGEYHYSDDGEFYDAHESRGEHYNEDTGWREIPPAPGFRNLGGRSGKAKVVKLRRQSRSKLKEENEGPISGI